jgi:hypothetical protein
VRLALPGEGRKIAVFFEDSEMGAPALLPFGSGLGTAHASPFYLAYTGQWDGRVAQRPDIGLYGAK